VRAAESLGASQRQIFLHIIAPGALPAIFTGLQIAVGISWFSLVAAEMVSGEYGLGYLINTAFTKIQYPTIAIGMATLGMVGYATSAMVRLIGRQLTEWRERELGVGGS
jgi:NitT/TauT family transport system permease protein